MNLDEATILLNQSERHELRDHAFGDMEITWTKDGKEVADGYIGGGKASVGFPDGTFFEDQAARNLALFGKLASTERNDETGPDNFELGKTMPGLTKEGVKQELVTHNVFEQNEDPNG